MKGSNIYSYRTDLKSSLDDVLFDEDVKVIEDVDNYIYRTIIFNDLNSKKKIKEELIRQLVFLYDKLNIVNSRHFLIVGIGNDNYTSDSVGPKTLKHIKVNYDIEMGASAKIKVSALEPGAFGETGILTEKIISSISKEIKPDIIILIDSYVTDNINYLNKTIEINNRGLYPGCGIESINSRIDRESINIPIIVIGVPTAIEVKFSLDNVSNFIPYLLSTKDVDKYINDISKILGEGINEFIGYLLGFLYSND